MAMQTYIYKKVGVCEIRADVHRAGEGGLQPAVVWIHGGCLIMGHRGWIAGWQLNRYLEAGLTVVSIDYRLAPETKLPAIVDDLQDAFRWVQSAGPALLGVDPRRVAAVGHSAGGYLALMAGVVVEPRPAALVAFYGYGDIVGPWYSAPDPHYCRQSRVSPDRAYRGVGRSPTSCALGSAERQDYYIYLRQNGLWPLEVAGHDPRTEPAFFRSYCPVRNVNREYPPTMLLHGDQDTDVPYEQSVMMAETLSRARVEHELITIEGGEHGFDASDDETARGAVDRAIEFLRAHLG